MPRKANQWPTQFLTRSILWVCVLGILDVLRIVEQKGQATLDELDGLACDLALDACVESGLLRVGPTSYRLSMRGRKLLRTKIVAAA